MQTPDGKLPEIIVFAGPNGSGKTTIARMAKLSSHISTPTTLNGLRIAMI